jgi:hypothetical protein
MVPSRLLELDSIVWRKTIVNNIDNVRERLEKVNSTPREQEKLGRETSFPPKEDNGPDIPDHEWNDKMKIY